MTTFQDPQPQSRRAVRQGERGDGQDSAFPSQPPVDQEDAPQYFDPNAQRDMWDTNARRAAQLPPTPAPRPESAVTGRRAATNATPSPAAAEPLTYSTASRQPAPEPQSFRSRLDARQAAQPPVAPAPGTSGNALEEQSFRVRDFSPEGRRAAQAAERAAVAPAWLPQTPANEVDYQTDIREGFATPPAPAAPPQPSAPTQSTPASPAPAAYTAPEVAPSPQAYPAPAAVPAPPAYAAPQPLAQPTAEPQPYAASRPVAPGSDAPGEQTMSRRELRAIIAEEESVRAGDPFDPLGQVPRNAPVAWQSPTPAPLVDQVPFAAPAPLQPPAAPAPIAWVAPQQAPDYDATRFPEPARLGAPPEPVANTGMTNALAEFDSLAAPPATAQPESKRARVNHWSAQDEDHEDIETTINRRVGSGSTATNALVLPEIPGGADIRGPLTSTGEVMLTGSIDLPRSLSSTGTTSRIDHDGIDGLFDANDHEVVSTDSQPVRAVTAISTHQTGHGVTHTQKPKGTRALTVLLISASSMAVIVAGLLVAAFAFKLF